MCGKRYQADDDYRLEHKIYMYGPFGKARMPHNYDEQDEKN